MSEHGDFHPDVDRLVVRHVPAGYDEESGVVFCAVDCPACNDQASLAEFWRSFEEDPS
jgi:hypothetical protein